MKKLFTLEKGLFKWTVDIYISKETIYGTLMLKCKMFGLACTKYRKACFCYFITLCYCVQHFAFLVSSKRLYILLIALFFLEAIVVWMIKVSKRVFNEYIKYNVVLPIFYFCIVFKHYSSVVKVKRKFDPWYFVKK